MDFFKKNKLGFEVVLYSGLAMFALLLLFCIGLEKIKADENTPVHFIFRDALPEYPFMPGVTVKMFHSAGNSFSWTKIGKGSQSPHHAHPMEQTSVLIEGRLEALVNGETKVLNPGDAMLIPAGSQHQFKALENSLILEIFQPRLPQSAIDAITKGQPPKN